MYNKYFNHEKGITGLETAIILIAFVVVAAVFAYTALSAGLFSTQKAQEAVYSGLTEARSTLELRGPVVATGNSTTPGDEKVTQISFVVSNVLGGEAIDFTGPNKDASGLAADGSSNKVVIKYIDADQTVNDLYWSAAPLGVSDGDAMLDPGEKFLVTIGDSVAGQDGGNLDDALGSKDLGINSTFSLEIVSPAGAVLTIERTIPASIEPKMNLN